jgi:hypothetical protein
MEGDWPEVDDDGFARLCERCHKPVPIKWDYAWCKDCGENGYCDHGNKPSNCNECMIESDIAFDSMRSKHTRISEPGDAND